MDEVHDIKLLFRVVTVIITLLFVLFVIYGLRLGIFADKMVLVSYIRKFGIIAPIFFILLQVFQVIFPVIPGGASCLAGVLAFGPLLGFIYNYIGLVLGSVFVFFLTRKYGVRLLYKLFDSDTIEKYLIFIRTNRFNRIFFFGILLPGLPDDLLCYVAGVSKISFKKFLFIILIGKPLALIMYSIFINLF